jgi:hypothetical protein
MAAKSGTIRHAMNPLQYIRKKRHVVVFAALIATLASAAALMANQVFLDPLAQPVVLASTIVNAL